ncbi:carbohydrate ABC transporter permease [Paenibacillus sp. FSL H7-0331]|uniref:carbohydrate ABC transporter permease n=1 Tax=Paenibacillus sp. FSL H7-0331 TaxID=1920421 RepID=UPI0021167048|nr:carbohydrate ABC transporter permease [Paenibacillus sp. FSL H7-0331]
MRKTRYGVGLLILELLLILSAVLMLYPFYLTFLNSFKTYLEVSQSLIALPGSWTLDNFSKVWVSMNYPRALLNSIIVTVCSVGGVLLVSSAAAYRLVRSPGKVSQLIFFLVLSSMVIPFQIVMIPALKVAKDLYLINSVYGLVIMYWGFLVPMALFLYHGFVKTIPIELEEAAFIDGCGPFKMFYKVVMPLLMPITTTIAIINVLGVFNDFMLPLVMISSDKFRTLPLAVSIFFGDYGNEWNSIMAALTISMFPIIVFFLFMQRFIIQGLVAGAVKG